MGSTLTLPTPRGFDLARAVCSYGYFLLAPNLWDPAGQTLSRPLRGRGDRLIPVTIRQPAGRQVLVLRCGVRVERDERGLIHAQVRRMLRLDEDLSGWFRIHPRARRRKFGRLFRSPTLFEDMIKTITGCNVTWRNTMRMNELLCQVVGQGGFPTPKQLAAWRPDRLKRATKVGYRAQRIVRLARDVAQGRLDLAWFEAPERDSQEVYQALRRIHGIGDYAASNLCQLLGFYDRLAIDTETYRHFCLQHNLPRPKSPSRLHARIEAHYRRFAPYDFLAYWFDLWQDYEQRFGDARQWLAHRDGANFTASRLR
ncbi:MAG TPA: hypothetical protein VF184_06975 [Phycisphaeraceae bacterium]